MPNRKARRAALHLKQQKAKMEEAGDRANPPPDHVADAPQEHPPGALIAERPVAQTDPIQPKREAHNTAKKPQRFEEVITKMWGFIKKPEHANAMMAIFTILIFIATLAYACVALLQWGSMRESNRISRESLESVQRAFVSLHSIEFSRGKVGDVAKVNIQPVWENTGTTPAIHAISDYTVLVGPVGITEDLFKSSGIATTQSRLVETIIASKATQGGVVSSWDEASIFGVNLVDNFENFPNAHQRGDVWIFGWTVYRDVMPNTKDHLTEFCRHLEQPGLIAETPPKIKYNLSTCPTHNCEDEYCPDYAEIVAYAEAKPST